MGAGEQRREALIAWCVCLNACDEFDDDIAALESGPPPAWAPIVRTASGVFGLERREATRIALQEAGTPIDVIATAWREAAAMSPEERRAVARLQGRSPP